MIKLNLAECPDCLDTGRVPDDWFCDCERGWELWGETKPTAPKEIHQHDIRVNHEKCETCGLWPHMSSCDGEHYISARRAEAVIAQMEKEAEKSPPERRFAHLETLDVLRTRLLGEGCTAAGVTVLGAACVSWDEGSTDPAQEILKRLGEDE